MSREKTVELVKTIGQKREKEVKRCGMEKKAETHRGRVIWDCHLCLTVPLFLSAFRSSRRNDGRTMQVFPVVTRILAI
jgi:hypothetical protein